MKLNNVVNEVSNKAYQREVLFWRILFQDWGKLFCKTEAQIKS